MDTEGVRYFTDGLSFLEKPLGKVLLLTIHLFGAPQSEHPVSERRRGRLQSAPGMPYCGFRPVWPLISYERAPKLLQVRGFSDGTYFVCPEAPETQIRIFFRTFILASAWRI
jgi:hypothetical protein